MNVYLNNFSLNSFPLLPGKILSSITPQHKKIVAIVTVALASLALCYAIIRNCCFRAEPLAKKKMAEVESTEVVENVFEENLRETALDVDEVEESSNQKEPLSQPADDLYQRFCDTTSLITPPTTPLAVTPMTSPYTTPFKHLYETPSTTPSRNLFASPVKSNFSKQVMAYVYLASTLSAEDVVVIANRREMNRQALLLEAVRLDPDCAPAYLGLFDSFFDDTRKLNGVEVKRAYYTLHDNSILTQKGLCLKMIEIDPTMAAAYERLGSLLSESDPDIVLPGRRLMTKHELLAEAGELVSGVRDDTMLRSNKRLKDETMHLEDKAIERELEGIALNPDLALGYEKLGLELTKDEIIVVNGVEMNQQQLFIKALQLEPNSAYTYLLLAGTLPVGGSIQLPDGLEMTQQQLFLKAIELDSSDDVIVAACFNLAITLPIGGSVELHDGTIMTKQDLFREVIEWDLSYAYAYFNLFAADEMQLQDLTKETWKKVEIEIQMLENCKHGTVKLDLGGDLWLEGLIRTADGEFMEAESFLHKIVDEQDPKLFKKI